MVLPLVGIILFRPTGGPQPFVLARQGTHATKWPPHAQWARPAGHCLQAASIVFLSSPKTHKTRVDIGQPWCPMSFTQLDILDIEIKKVPEFTLRGLLHVWHDLSPLKRRICP